jgi:hypothetical protein
LTLSAKAAILVTAIGKMSGKLHKQAMVEIEIGGDKFNLVFLVAPLIMVPMITGADFLDDDKINLSFKDRSLQADRDGVVIKYRFNGEDGQETAGHNEKNPCDDSEYIGTYTTNTLELESGDKYPKSFKLVNNGRMRRIWKKVVRKKKPHF